MTTFYVEMDWKTFAPIQKRLEASEHYILETPGDNTGRREVHAHTSRVERAFIHRATGAVVAADIPYKDYSRTSNQTEEIPRWYCAPELAAHVLGMELTDLQTLPKPGR